jgi:hypothetical protein
MREYHRDYGTFQLESWGNGVAYALTHKASGLSTYLQGDDALQFEKDRESIETTFPHMTDDEVMSYIWDQYDYSAGALDRNI